MCGLAGYLTRGADPSDPRALLERMGAAIHHRGPDSTGSWADPEAGIGLSHKRLAIVELSEEDAGAARQALWRLQADWPTLERLERQVGGQPEQAALRVGAAIHLARAELSSPDPHLRQRLPELLDLLKAEGR